MVKNIDIEWQDPGRNPPYTGQYFVAVKYHNGLGAYDLLSWDGEKWEIDYHAEIVGWVTMTDFMGSIKAGWPMWDECIIETENKIDRS